jgi:hypothetical protein
MLDNFKRKFFLKNEIKKIILKSLLKNKTLPQMHRYFALFNYSKIIRTSSQTQHQNRCVKTGRI